MELKVRQIGLLKPIFQKVRIAQKTVKFSPAEKLVDALITILAGAHGLVEANKRVRPDPGLQQAFGRSGCAEQSVIQDTLDACTSENVKQMEEALAVIYRQHSRGYRHPYDRQWQILDIDITGRPCGPKAAFATPGYFSRQRNRRGRQAGYVLATRYEEVVVQQVFSGNESLTKALRPLVEAAESVLELDDAKRRRTILRIDAGGGTVEHINWLLEQGYQLHCKDYSGHRAENGHQCPGVVHRPQGPQPPVWVGYSPYRRDIRPSGAPDCRPVSEEERAMGGGSHPLHPGAGGGVVPGGRVIGKGR